MLAPLRAILMRSASADAAPCAQQLPQSVLSVFVVCGYEALFVRYPRWFVSQARRVERTLRDVLVQALGDERLSVDVRPAEALWQASFLEVVARHGQCVVVSFLVSFGDDVLVESFRLLRRRGHHRAFLSRLGRERRYLSRGQGRNARAHHKK